MLVKQKWWNLTNKLKTEVSVGIEGKLTDQMQISSYLSQIITVDVPCETEIRSKDSVANKTIQEEKIRGCREIQSDDFNTYVWTEWNNDSLWLAHLLKPTAADCFAGRIISELYASSQSGNWAIPECDLHLRIARFIKSVSRFVIAQKQTHAWSDPYTTLKTDHLKYKHYLFIVPTCA